MKRSLLIGSFLCVGLGIIALIFAFIGATDVIAIVVLLTAYFVGIPIQFYKTLPADEARQLSEGRIISILGRRFWIPISLGVIAAIIAAFTMKNLYDLSTGSTILVALGVAAILTAFVSPRFETVELPNTDSFG